MDIEKMLSEMTLEEKASLLSGEDFWHTKTINRLGLPAIMMSDGPHGLRKQDERVDHLGVNESIQAVCFPAASATAASFDPELVRQVGEAMGQACQHEKLGVILGPAVNIKRSPLCGRNFEYFSEDPFLAAELAAALIQGVQSQGVGTSIKHFAANSQEHRRMSSDSVVEERALREIYLPAFEKAVKNANPWTFMCSYNKLNGEYASENHWLLTKVLREEWGYEGLVMSDWGAVSDRVKGVAAGLDLEMPGSCGANDARIVKAVQEGRLSEADVDTCVRRVLRLVERCIENARPGVPWDMEAQHQLAGKLSAECMVLLKNEGEILPLAENETIAVIGRFAKQPRFQGGGSSHINSFKVESLMDALQGEEKILYAQGYGIDTEEPEEALIAEAVETAKKADKVVIVGGLPDSFESEGYDRTHMRMPACQNELIRRVAEANANTVVILYNGSPVEMPWADCVKGIVEAYLGGQAVGRATKAILWGEVNPCGRLPESFPYQLEDNPSYLSYGGEGDVAPYTEGIFVGYRYYDKKKMPVRYPFGYGLSYTSFAYSNLKVSEESITDTQSLTVSVDVTNTGNREGKEVVQLYVAPPAGDRFRPVRELKGIAKQKLAPGQTKTVRFTLDKRSFACWEPKIQDWFVPAGSYGIQIGRSSRQIELETQVQVKPEKDLPRERLTPDSIFLDISRQPQAVKEKLAPMLSQVGFDRDQEGPASNEAITEDMTNAMIQYMPLRGGISFGDGKITYEDLLKLCEELNTGK